MVCNGDMILLQEEHNTAILEKAQHELANADHFSLRIEPEDIEMEEELGNEQQEGTYDFKLWRGWKKTIMNRLKRLPTKMSLYPNHP